MAVKQDVSEKEAIAHLKKIYDLYLKEGGDPDRFTIRQYNRLNDNSHMYIDIFVKRFGGWNTCLEKAGIPLGFRQYKKHSNEEIAQYVNKVYKIYLKEEGKGKARSKGEKVFRMRDYVRYNEMAGNKFSLAIILKRFGSWSEVLKQLDIPIGRTRGLTREQIADHVKRVYEIFREHERPTKIFSKEMYDKYNFVEDVYISSKLVERRFGTWVGAKKALGLKP
ncbi:MAG: hypothetical protein D6767_03320 [Candidatus Hydrogenedentota bacterium]|nr:MAG: hypothetical protein D6767_03320 [Candidatus Hydrogenedentota bacterium]